VSHLSRLVCLSSVDPHTNNTTVGNRRFRVCIENNLSSYEKARSKHQRSLVVTIIVDAIQDSNSSCDGVGFVRRDLDQDRWYEVNDKIARYVAFVWGRTVEGFCAKIRET
jgi:hypothetical protein